MTEHPTRRELLRPVQLLGLAFAAAAFAGVVTLIATGFFQQRFAEQSARSGVLALIVAGIAFIVTLVSIALLMLAVDPSTVTRTVDRPVLLPPKGDEEPEAPADSRHAAGPDHP